MTPSEFERQRILRLLAGRTWTQKQLLAAGGRSRDKRDEIFRAIESLVDEGQIVIVSRRVAISPDGSYVGFKNTRYALAETQVSALTRT